MVNERIIYSYEMHMNKTRISVSLATVELKLEGTGTKLIFTGQGVFLDGQDKPAEREHGTRGKIAAATGRRLKQRLKRKHDLAAEPRDRDRR
jgi:hypothetical protein